MKLRKILKIKTRTWLVLTVAALFSLPACEENGNISIDANDYFQIIELEYNRLEQTTTARAFFKEKDKDGEAIILDEGGEIRVNNTLLTQEKEGSATYITSFDNYIDTNYVDYADKEGNLYTNEIHLSDIDPIYFPVNVGPFNILRDQTINWKGPPLSEGEVVIFQMGHLGSNSIQKTIKEEGANSIKLSNNDLIQVGEGQAKMIIYRISKQSLENTTEAGGMVQLFYTSGLTTIELY